jgi:radical SAM superfamily enzyme YgiQ (UPF0313 family)
MGLEGEESSYAKLRNVDTRQLVRSLQSHGIRVLGSSIIGLENHTPGNIDGVIDYAVSHATDFHQFMLYTPVPGTPLYSEHRERGTLIEDVDVADTHGQYQFNFRHPHITPEQSGEYLLRAFQRDYRVNGPSVLRIARTTFQGYQRYKDHPDPRIRERFRRDASTLPVAYAGALWAMEKYFRDSNATLSARVRRLRSDFHLEFGLKSWLAAHFGGPAIRAILRREEKRLESGWTYQPPFFLERRNWEPVPQN